MVEAVAAPREDDLQGRDADNSSMKCIGARAPGVQISTSTSSTPHVDVDADVLRWWENASLVLLVLVLVLLPLLLLLRCWSGAIVIAGVLRLLFLWNKPVEKEGKGCIVWEITRVVDGKRTEECGRRRM